MKEVRIYAEGGGEGQKTKAAFRLGLSQFFSPIKRVARNKKVKWEVIACGPRGTAFEKFQSALKNHPEAFNVLLVDSEGPLRDASAWGHLRLQDGWNRSLATDDQCHLMVQAMEAWLIADPEALKIFYGQGFNPKSIPKTSDVETIEKKRLNSALRAATRQSAKGSYHKTLHAPLLLGKLNVETVKSKAPHCRRLFKTLAGMME